eukprot:TRINITY_DN37630_c0_g1_i1.p1 TRINITY_DN37630_c0_g1~~TRINITY_DN37630_c0_g1_i1.p1  ORF type:complete len:145 (+),score=19.98 TRINITY_DN37630_c0_g1_i1:140-574(+)
MLEVLNSEPVNAKRLSALIGGSLLPLVNGGVNQICDAFLNEDATDEDDGLTSTERTRQRALLRKVMREFIEACKRALDVNKTMSVGDEKSMLFHNEVASKFDNLCTYLQPLIYESKGKKEAVQSKGPKTVSFADPTTPSTPSTP